MQKIFDTIGFDIDPERIQALKSCNDFTLEIDSKDLQKASRLSFTDNEANISECNIYIVTVPTPIDINKRPNLLPLMKASATAKEIVSAIPS